MNLWRCRGFEEGFSLADWLMNTWQRKDGAYVNHNTVYTSVIYVAKSMLELTLVERELGKTESVWKEAATVTMLLPNVPSTSWWPHKAILRPKVS